MFNDMRISADTMENFREFLRKDEKVKLKTIV